MRDQKHILDVADEINEGAAWAGTPAAITQRSLNAQRTLYVEMVAEAAAKTEGVSVSEIAMFARKWLAGLEPPRPLTLRYLATHWHELVERMQTQAEGVPRDRDLEILLGRGT